MTDDGNCPSRSRRMTMEPPRILVVDDDPDTCLILMVNLQAAGYRTLSAEDAYQAVVLAWAEQPDVLLLDLGLPAGGGYSVLARLRAEPRSQALPVIVITGQDPTLHLERLRAFGVLAVLPKPVVLPHLKRVLQRVLGRAGDD